MRILAEKTRSSKPKVFFSVGGAVLIKDVQVLVCLVLLVARDEVQGQPGFVWVEVSGWYEWVI